MTNRFDADRTRSPAPMSARRDLIKGAGSVLTMAALDTGLGIALSGNAHAADNAAGDCMTILYPAGEGLRFNDDYYRDRHLPLIMKLYGQKAIKRFELRKGSSDMAGGAPKYIGTVNIYIADQKAFDAAQAQHGDTLREDVASFSSVMPTAFATVIRGLN